MKNKIKIIALIIACSFSFAYTEKLVGYIKNKDPLMKDIKENEFKYKINPTQAEVKGKYIIPGKKGKRIDYKKTYNNMKKYGKYNELLMTFKEIYPNTRINENYDKYINIGNKENRNISIILYTNNLSPKEITNIQGINNSISICINEDYLEKYYKEIKIYLKNYNILLQNASSTNNISYLKTIVGQRNAYCYLEQENDNILKKCEKEKLHTIIPKIVISNNYFHRIKSAVSNGYIIKMTLDKKLEHEFFTIKTYLENKGYNIVSLNKLLEE